MLFPRTSRHPARPSPRAFSSLSILLASLALSSAHFLFAAPARPAAGASEVSRTPPPVYAEKLAPHLTPLDDAIKLIPEIHDDTASGIILIDDLIYWVDEQGRRTIARHTVCKALAEAAVENIASDTFPFRKHDQRFHLVLAETIQPDGAVLPVKPNAIILQTPQRQADDALFDDLAEVRVIYPNVKPGSITRTITVVEDLRARMPGEYAQSVHWGYGWPVAISRDLIDMPASLANRVRLFPLGSGVPGHTVETTADGRVRHDWRQKLIPARKFEPRRAPSTQAGPAVTLTSIASWDDVARWYSGLTAGRDKLSPELAAKVDEWTRGLDAAAPAKPGGTETDRDKIIRILFTKVANDVRYTGLEFGDADYQPHDCNEVWENQYGDCKDKANLLAAFLRHKKIPAHIALINTNHLGLIDRRAPNYRVFNHAITAIDDPRAPGGYVFCDPTITWAEPGMLHNGDTDRDVLVVKSETAGWARTPAQKDCALDYNFDLQLAPSGEISGWLTVTSKGYYACGWRSWLRRYETDGLRRSFQRHIRPFYAGANVIDVVAEPAATTAGPCVAKAYFIVPGQSAATQSLALPVSGDLLPEMGNSADRATPFPLSPGLTTVNVTMKLAPGIAPSRQPEPWQISTPVCDASARWDFSAQTQTCAASLSLDLTQPSVSAAEFGRLYQAMQSLRAWLKQPAVLAASDGARPAQPQRETAPALDFPLMPTGEGQLELADQRYPVNGNRVLARAALEKTIQYFPGDKPTVFTATVNLARIDWYADKNQEALDRISPLLAAYKSDVPPNTHAWGEYIQALILRDLKRDAEALAICERAAADTRISPYRRSLAALAAGGLLEKTDPARALAVLDAVATLRSSEQADVIAAITRLRLRQNDNDALRVQLGSILQTQAGEAQALFASVIGTSKKWDSDDASALLPDLEKTITALVPEPGAELNTALAALRARVAASRVSGEVRAALVNALGRKPWSELHKPPAGSDTLKDFAGYKREIKNAEEKKDATRCAHLYLQSLIALPAGADFANRLEKTVLYFEWKDRQTENTADDPLFTLLCELSDRFPPDSDVYNEARLQLADYHQRRAKHGKVRTIYEAMTLSPKTPRPFAPAAFAGLGKCHEENADYAAALAAYRELEKLIDVSYRAADGLARAVFINLHENRPDEALRLIGILETCSDATLKKANGEYDIRDFIKLKRSGKAAQFWAARKQWWPQWQALEKKLKLSTTNPKITVPLIPNPDSLTNSINAAIREKKPADFWPAMQHLASAARWLPKAGATFASVNVQNIAPAEDPGFTRISIKLLEIPVSPENYPRDRQFQLAHALMSAKKHDACLKTIAAFEKNPRVEDWMTYTLHRIWAQTALASKKQMPGAAAAIERDLTDPGSQLSSGRNHSVSNLSALYRAMDKPDEEAALLAREITHPWFAANADARDVLKKRSEQLTGSKQLASQISSWLRDNPIPWYDYAEPASLDDPRLRNLDDALRKATSIFSIPEIAKLHLLVAQSTAGTQERQRDSMIWAAAYLLHQYPSFKKVRAFFDGILERPGFDQEIQRRLRLSALWNYFHHDQKESFQHMLESIKPDQLTQQQKKMIEAYKAGMDADPLDAESLAGAIREIAAGEIDGSCNTVIGELFGALLDLGDLDAARKVMDEARAWRFANDANLTANAVVFDFARRVRAVETLQPMHAAMQRALAGHITELPDTLPGALADMRYTIAIPPMRLEDQRTLCLWHLKRGSFERSSLNLWASLITALKNTRRDEEIAVALFRAAIESAPDDETRGQAFDAFTGSLDLDEAWIREKIAEAVAPYRDPAAHPRTCEHLRMYDLKTALRAGEQIDPLVALPEIKNAHLLTERFHLAFSYYLRRADKAALRQIVAQANSSQLLETWNLPLAIKAFDLLEMKTEAAMARDIARRELRNHILESWSGGLYQVQAAIILAEALAEPALVPDAWVSAIATENPDPRMRRHVRLLQAKLRGNWAAMLDHTDAILRDYPTHYHYYWYKAGALWKLGRKAEARSALEIYTKYAKDEPDYPEAMRMLKELADAP